MLLSQNKMRVNMLKILISVKLITIFSERVSALLLTQFTGKCCKMYVHGVEGMIKENETGRFEETIEIIWCLFVNRNKTVPAVFNRTITIKCHLQSA